MDDGLVQIILALIGLLGTVLTALVVPLIKLKYDAAKRARISEYVDITVGAADQILKINDPTGEKRKLFVINYLESKGFKINSKDLDLMIESSVQMLNLFQKQALE